MSWTYIDVCRDQCPNKAKVGFDRTVVKLSNVFENKKVLEKQNLVIRFSFIG